MRRTTPAVVAVMLVLGALAAFPVAGLAGQTTDTPTDTPTESNESANATVSPGERLAGVVGAQEAEIDGEVQSRSYGIEVARAASNDSRAAIAADQLDDVEQRLTDLEDRRQALDEARANGSMSEGEYRARIARLHAESRAVERLTNQSGETVRGLPEETVRANGIDASAIQALTERANQLSGPEVAGIARSIAGENAGNGFGPEGAGEASADRGGNGQGNASDASGDDARGNGSDRGNGTNGSDDRGRTTETATEQA